MYVLKTNREGKEEEKKRRKRRRGQMEEPSRSQAHSLLERVQMWTAGLCGLLSWRCISLAHPHSNPTPCYTEAT